MDIMVAIGSIEDSVNLYERLPLLDSGCEVDVDAIRSLLADHARLQADAERLDWMEGFVRKAYVYGVSFDYAKSCDGESGGYRFMTRHRLDDRQSTLRGAIDAAKAGSHD